MKCPKCGKDIDYLKNYSKYEEVFEFSISLTSGEPQYDQVDAIPGDENDYECPECGEVLFTSEQEAIEFLKGGVE